ncbi:MAG TPA: hypothetical protein VGI43_20080 [Mucilaginibacter sp.]|jgi:hypothetical protein
MYKINYDVIDGSFDKIETIRDDKLRYNFLLGNVVFSSDEVKIEMEWHWIPLLDFSLCLSYIANALSNKEKASECFDFTESGETLEFSRDKANLKIVPSFCSNIIEITFDEFNKEVKKLHDDIRIYIKERTIDRTISDDLKKYL